MGSDVVKKLNKMQQLLGRGRDSHDRIYQVRCQLQQVKSDMTLGQRTRLATLDEQMVDLYFPKNMAAAADGSITDALNLFQKTVIQHFHITLLPRQQARLVALQTEGMERYLRTAEFWMQQGLAGAFADNPHRQEKFVSNAHKNADQVFELAHAAGVTPTPAQQARLQLVHMQIADEYMQRLAGPACGARLAPHYVGGVMRLVYSADQNGAPAEFFEKLSQGLDATGLPISRADVYFSNLFQMVGGIKSAIGLKAAIGMFDKVLTAVPEEEVSSSMAVFRRGAYTAVSILRTAASDDNATKRAAAVTRAHTAFSLSF